MTRSSGRCAAPYTFASGKSRASYTSTASTVNTATPPSRRSTSMVLPLRSAPREKKTAGPSALSTWPATIAVPRSPGVVPASYQPARFFRAAGGTSRLPVGVSPRPVSGASTSIAGMRIRSGGDGGSAGADTGPPLRSASAARAWAGEAAGAGAGTGGRRRGRRGGGGAGGGGGGGGGGGAAPSWSSHRPEQRATTVTAAMAVFPVPPGRRNLRRMTDGPLPGRGPVPPSGPRGASGPEGEGTCGTGGRAAEGARQIPSPLARRCRSQVPPAAATARAATPAAVRTGSGPRAPPTPVFTLPRGAT